MRIPAIQLFFAIALLPPSLAVAAPFTSHSLVVLQVGDGSGALGSSATPAFIKEFGTNGVLLQTVAIPTAGGSQLTLSGTATTDGELAVSADKKLLTFAGYVAAVGAAGPVSADASTVNRAIGVLDTNGTFSRVGVSTTACSGANARGAVSDGVNYWLCGDSSGAGDANGGIWFSSRGATPIQVRAGNLRCVKIIGSRLYFSSAASTGPYGIHDYINLPTDADSSSLVFGATSGIGNPSPNAFAVSPDGTLAYVADDRAATDGGGVQRWTNNGAAWALEYTLSIGATGTSNLLRQIAVDFDGPHPVIYATTSETSANRLVAIDDTNAVAGSSFRLLAVAGSNTVFRGVSFSPVPEPAMRVLFLGNSLLGISSQYANDIPLHLSNLAVNLGDSFSYVTIANSGWELLDHATNGPTTNAINSGGFDLVVLQDQSDNASQPSVRSSRTFPASRTLNTLITNHAERAMFYETWGYINGDTASHCNGYDIPAQYKTCDGGFGSFSAMNIATRQGYALIASELGAPISPVGLAWARVRVERPDLNLYILDDGYGDRHPNSYAAYLAACVFYGSIFGRSPEGSTYYSTNNVADAQYLQRVAGETVFDDPFATDAYGFAPNRFRWASPWQNFTNPPDAPPATVVISGAGAAPSPSVLVNTAIGSMGNLWLGTLGTNYLKAGQGRLYISAGASLVVTGAMTVGREGKGFVRHNGGNLVVNGALTLGEQGGSFGQYTLSNGTLRAAQILGGAGVGTFRFCAGSLNFGQFGSVSRSLDLFAEAGTLALTNTSGTTQIRGNFTNGTAAILALELASTNDSLAISGHAALDGSLRLAWAPAFAPAVGQKFTLLSAASISGNFTNFTLPTVTGSGLGLIASVTSTSLVAVVSNFAAVLDSVTLTNANMQFRVGGIAGSTYVLQTSTNLVNWTPLQTNDAPFSCTINIGSDPHRFYRAVFLR